MNIRAIRDAFPACRIKVSNKGITLGFYDFSKSGHASAHTPDDSVFKHLVEKSDAINIVLYPHNYGEFSFLMDFPVESNMDFDPIETENEMFARLEQMHKDRENVQSIHFVRAFQGVDPDDTSAVMKGLAEFLDATKEEDQTDITGIVNWKRLKPVAREFHNASGFLEYEEEEPSEYCDFGCVSFYIEIKMYSEFNIVGRDLELFKKMVSISDGFDITVYNGDDLMAFSIELNS